MTAEQSIPPEKRCAKCGETFPATKEYFYIMSSRGKPRVGAYCKPCHNTKTAITSMAWNRANPDRVREAQRRFYDKPESKTKRSESARAWRMNNPEKVRAAWQRQQQKRRGVSIKRSTIGRLKRRASNQKYKARKRNLPNTLSGSEWIRAIDYFHGCCAVCDRQMFDLFATHTIALDHWVPMTSPDCPGTVVSNVIPLCHGIDGCNNSKHNKPADKWLVSKFGKRKAKAILSRIETYFDWVRSQPHSEEKAS